MPLKTSVAGETVGMRLVDAKLDPRIGPLPRFIARRRTPGDGWKSFDAIATELAVMTGEPVTRQGVIKWAKAYGIPLHSKRNDPPEVHAAYLAAVRRYVR